MLVRRFAVDVLERTNVAVREVHVDTFVPSFTINGPIGEVRVIGRSKTGEPSPIDCAWG